MAKIKGLKKLNKAITAQLAPFGIKKAKFANDYAFYWAKSLITYKITENETEDIWFKEFVEERFNYEIPDAFLFSLLHEVGHYNTIEEVSDCIQDFCFSEKDRISDEMQKIETTEQAKILEWQYFNLPDEIIATAWAVDYAKNHPKKVKKIIRELHKAFCDFYAKNEIEDD